MSSIAVRPVSSISELYRSFRLAHQNYLKAGLTSETPSELRYFLADLLPVATTFVVDEERHIVGTAAALQYSPAGLPSGSLFLDIVHDLLDQNRSILESTRFACVVEEAEDKGRRAGRSVIAAEIIRAIFQLCRSLGVDDWLITVHPNHVAYYRDRLGFVVISDVRSCGHVVDNPGVMMRIEVNKVVEPGAELLPSAKELFLSRGNLPPSVVQHRPWFDDEVGLFFAIDPANFENRNKVEDSALTNVYPRLMRQVRTIEEKRLSFKPLDQVEGDELLNSLFPEDRHINVPQPRTKPTPRFFDLCEELQRLLFPMALRAERHQLQIKLSLDRTVSKQIALDLPIFRKLLVSALNQAISSAVPYSEICFGITHRELREGVVALDCRVIGSGMSVPSDCRQYAPVIGGTVWLMRQSNQESVLEMSIPALLSGHNLTGKRYQSYLLARYRNLFDVLAPDRQQVLVQESNSTDREIVRRVLEKYGHSVFVAENAQTALRIRRSKRVDVVVLGHGPTERFGSVIMRELRYIDKKDGRKTPIVGLTGVSPSDGGPQPWEFGFDYCVAKPFSQTTLLNAVHQSLETARYIPSNLRRIITHRARSQ